MLGSMLTALPLVSGLPLVPPFGFLMLLAWRFVRPGLLPVWAGLPLGLWDDLFSGTAARQRDPVMVARADRD